MHSASHPSCSVRLFSNCVLCLLWLGEVGKYMSRRYFLMEWRKRRLKQCQLRTPGHSDSLLVTTQWGKDWRQNSVLVAVVVSRKKSQCPRGQHGGRDKVSSTAEVVGQTGLRFDKQQRNWVTKKGHWCVTVICTVALTCDTGPRVTPSREHLPCKGTKSSHTPAPSLQRN